MFFFLFMSLLFMPIKQNKSISLITNHIPVILVDFYVNFLRFFASRIRFMKRVQILNTAF